MSVSVKWFGQPVEEVIAGLNKQVKEKEARIENLKPDAWATVTIRLNTDNEKLSDREFRDFVRNTLTLEK